ncbi:MAG TPA: tRNA pseudouridine(55) synthase TruB [Beutenbergiaceae bacterium]|nr:tRNA pseudouridine(55) synthase TruB [Beutenbergiaceae bacterium]
MNHPRTDPSGHGLVLIDKPAGWTSHDVVARVRRLAGTRKVGHAGTLDPMATGLLVLGVNRATRLLTYLVGADKEYTATIRLGQSTTTDDAEGQVRARAGVHADTEQRLPEQMAALTGAIEQVPSAVSAIKVDGERAYARVRAGEQVDLKARPVHVETFETTGPFQPGRAEDGTPVLDVPVRVVCSSGTYIRALARDLGEALGTGGHLTVLRRTRVGPLPVADAQDLGAVSEGTEDLRIHGLTPVCKALFEVLDLNEAQARAVRYGQGIEAPGPAPSSSRTMPATADGARADSSAVAPGAAADSATGAPGAGADSATGTPAADANPAPVAAAHPDGRVIGLLQRRGGQWRPVLVFDPA